LINIENALLFTVSHLLITELIRGPQGLPQVKSGPAPQRDTSHNDCTHNSFQCADSLSRYFYIYFL